MCDALQPQRGGPLRARVEERLLVESPLDETREICPDARVFESKSSERLAAAPSGAAAAFPVIIEYPDEEAVETFIEIHDRSAGDKLVTVIELLWPWNKLESDSKRKYQQKQRELLQAKINFVEIDLTRGGRRRLLVPQSRLSKKNRTTFQACVFRATSPRPRFEVYPIRLDAPVPTLAIPLRADDKDVVLELQPLIERAYANGAYDDIGYSQDAVPPFGGADAQWADCPLREARQRP
jgi:hypothetical protein